MTDLMKRGQEWFADKMQLFASRDVVYRGIRNGANVSATLTVGVGMSQLTSINLLGMQPGLGDATLADPLEVDRDYIVRAADLITADLWPPDSGDFVDDTHDAVGVTKRYQVKSVPGQSPWRWLRGSYNVLTRVHAKFFQEIATYWSDSFAGTDDLTAHTPEIGSGGYGGGVGSVTILTNRIVASAATSYHYFAPGQLNTVTSVDFRFNVSAADLDGAFAEIGLAVRCAPSGAEQRDGVYCTVKIGYVGAVQSRQLRMVRRRNDANTTVATLNLTAELALATTYKLIVTNTEDKVLLTLGDETGAVSIASVDNDSTLLNDYTGQGVWFEHTMDVPTGPWMDNLNVEAT